MTPTEQPILLLGGTGRLGREIAATLYAHGYETHALVRNMARAGSIRGLAKHITKVQALQPAHFRGMDTVISALGKSISPLDRGRFSFAQVDEAINLAAIKTAVEAGVRKFIYVSVYNAERLTHLEYCRVHASVEKALAASGLEYTIVKPVALFSAFRDLYDMALKGRLMNMGKGACRINPIHEKDVARLCVQAINGHRKSISAGGPVVYTRAEINEIIAAGAGRQKLRSMPAWPVKAALPLMRLADANLYHKMKFFVKMMEEDVIAPVEGHLRLETYIDVLSKSTRRFWDLPSGV
ncbi:NAD(P)H-binding protein [Chitinophaga sp.]|uniref:SDR family oxidoreductase n=1 Tax=Chitinophaga sp. TaxID=1869181 RepID=UPI0031DA95CE